MGIRPIVWFVNRTLLHWSGSIPSESAGLTSADTCPDSRRPVTFAWQFHPVLGQDTVEQNIRKALAQVSLAPISNPTGIPPIAQVTISRCWRKYDKKTGIVGEPTLCVDDDTPREVPITYNTLLVRTITPTDNGDGTITTTVFGTFPAGTRVGLGGNAYLSEASLGFENTGSYIRFSAPNQTVGTQQARLIGPDGTEADLVSSPGPVSNCLLPGRSRLATVTPFSDTISRVSVAFQPCVGFDQTYPPIVVVAGRAFGLSDNPFQTPSDSNVLTFLAPTALLQGQPSLVLRRLFLGPEYQATYALSSLANQTTVTSISFLGSAKTAAIYAVTGSGLQRAHISFPPAAAWDPPNTDKSDTYRTFHVSSDQLATAKSIVFSVPNAAPIIEALPAAANSGDSSSQLKITILQVVEGEKDPTKNTTTYLLTGPKGSALDQATFKVPLNLQWIDHGDTFIQFSLSPDQIKQLHAIVLKPPAQSTQGTAAPATGTNPPPAAPPIVVALPASQKDTTTAKATLVQDKKGVGVGSTAPYKIAGTNLDLVSEVRYLNVPVPFTYATDGTSLTIPQLPAALVANAGNAPLEIRFSDGTKQDYAVLINP